MLPMPFKRQALSPIGKPVHFEERLPLPRTVGRAVLAPSFDHPVVLTDSALEILGGTAVRVAQVFGSDAVRDDHTQRTW